MNRRKLAELLPVIIPSLIFLSFFFIPIIVSFSESFRDYGGRFVGLENYEAMFNDVNFYDALWYTAKLTIISIVIVIVSAVILAMALRRTFVGKKMTLFLLQVDISMPTITCASMMLIVLSQTGFTSSLFYNLGLLSSFEEFPNLFNDPKGYGVIITVVWMFIPYIALSFLAVLHSISNDLEDQAATLGVGGVRRFFHLTLPNLKSSIAYTSILCFACVFGSFELPSLVGREHSLVTLAYYYYNSALYSSVEHMEAYTISIMLFTITAAVSSVLMYYSLKSARRADR